MAHLSNKKPMRIAILSLAVIGASVAAASSARASAVDLLQIGPAGNPATLGPVPRQHQWHGFEVVI